jgi:hypothetical protein
VGRIDVGRVAAGPGDEFVAFYASGARVIGEFRCSDCGYGIVSRGSIPICPMCRGSSWEESLWRPFTRSVEAS